MLLSEPDIGVGRKRQAVWRALRPCTSWKKKLRICSKALKAPHIKKTFMQMLVKAILRHNEFLIRAGRPWRSWRPTQRTKAMINTMDSDRRRILVSELIFEALSVMDLSCPSMTVLS